MYTGSSMYILLFELFYNNNYKQGLGGLISSSIQRCDTSDTPTQIIFWLIDCRTLNRY